ncbi:retrotransposon protein, putative, ty1-copia subclass [Tanacetum coccineum]|uniref:Retrotransposon protein, putative, ty1-copia subclass n=1 Tax=Tanacetum coccineum TaxID=301880 RepID=A0ABQ5FSG1_9ASTR
MTPATTAQGGGSLEEKLSCVSCLVVEEKEASYGSSGFREARKLKQGALYLYVGNGVRAQVEAIGSYDLVLPNGLVICLDNCHYAPSITRGVVSRYPKEIEGVTIIYFPLENKIAVARYAEFFEKNLMTQEVSGRAIYLEEIQDEDTSPSEITSKISMEVEGFEPPQEEEILIRRSKRSRRVPNRLCLNVEVEEHSLGDLNEPTSYKAAMLDSESNKGSPAFMHGIKIYRELDLVKMLTARINLKEDIQWHNSQTLVQIPCKKELYLNRTQDAPTPKEALLMPKQYDPSKSHIKPWEDVSNASCIAVGETNSLCGAWIHLVTSNAKGDCSRLILRTQSSHLRNRGALNVIKQIVRQMANTTNRNLLKIITSCSSVDFKGNDFKAMVYEFMPNGCVHGWLHSSTHTSKHNILQRINILRDVATALDYLHNRCQTRVVHGDLKPNVTSIGRDMWLMLETLVSSSYLDRLKPRYSTGVKGQQ